jgi:hypothetical protein
MIKLKDQHRILIVLTSLILTLCIRAHGMQYIGISYFAQNSLNRSTSKDSGAGDIIGHTALLPLTYTYEMNFGYAWIFSPQFQWTILPHDSSTYTSSMMLANFPVGSALSNSWSWYAGPGLMFYTIKGAGGSKVLNNGTGTATFAVPDRTVTTKTITTDLGMAWKGASQRVAFGTLMESFLSTSGKRTYNLYLNWSYGFGGY